jgi:CubicO group peptidase (beta-lactamase class C family)
MRTTIATLLAFTLAFLSSPPTTRSRPRTRRSELARRWPDAQRAYDQIPGMSAAVVHDQKAFERRQRRCRGLAASADTLYSICSISKLFTSVAVMQLRDAGKLALDDPLSKHLPWFTMKPAEGGRDATIAGALTHSAGLPRESDYPY